MRCVVVNTRSLANPNAAGVHRYAQELLARFGDRVERVSPEGFQEGVRGHLWEQVVLPTKVGRCLLWSPTNTGPLSVRHQVLTLHDASALEHPEWFSKAFASWYGFLLPRLVHRVRRVIADSEFTRQRLLELTGLHPDQVVTILLGVDERFAPPDSLRVEQTRQALGIPAGPYVLSLGSLEPRKNLGRLIQAWGQVVGELPEDVYLVVAGARGKRLVFQEVELEPLPPRVHLTGRVPEEHLVPLFGGSLAFIYPAFYEGFGFPPLEAMATGTPVLTGNRTSLPEVVGNAALTVDPYSLDELADGIRRLVTDAELQNRLRALGLERAKQFSWERTAEQTWRVFEEATS